jgi:hypothetical protein
MRIIGGGGGGTFETPLPPPGWGELQTFIAERCISSCHEAWWFISTSHWQPCKPSPFMVRLHRLPASTSIGCENQIAPIEVDRITIRVNAVTILLTPRKLNHVGSGAPDFPSLTKFG